nr:MAG TPA: hypothetical protein [Caudoviricetes sp.]
MLAALPAVISEQRRREKYRSYLADCLQSISRNVAPIGRGEYIAKRWADISDPKPEETRTPEEIIAHMKQKIASA